ncbi:sugar ABC transporter permease [Streptococcus pneumoniae]|nr:sugar ABC transporter permease [Streptococcus pneumoniae]
MKQDERKALIGKYTLLILGTVLILVPLLATLFSSFKPTKDIRLVRNLVHFIIDDGTN